MYLCTDKNVINPTYNIINPNKILTVHIAKYVNFPRSYNGVLQSALDSSRMNTSYYYYSITLLHYYSITLAVLYLVICF